MVMILEEIPQTQQAPEVLPADIILTRDSFRSNEAWWRFNNTKPMKREDFLNPDDWLRYYFVTMRMIENAVIIIYGNEGGGKSLWMNVFCYQMKRLFGKKCTLDWHPRDAFGAYDFIDEEIFLEEWGKMTGLSKNKQMARTKGLDMTEAQAAGLKIYDRIIAWDEGYKYLERRRPMNAYGILIGDMIRQRRHYHNVILIAAPDRNDIDERMAWNRRTHEVVCSFGTRRPDTGSYIIRDRRTGMTAPMNIYGPNWYGIYDSYNAVGMRQKLKVKI